MDNIVDRLFDELSKLDQVEAIALGGSRSGESYDEKSDYDVYLYCTAPVPETVRRELLGKYCGRMEIGNSFWEYEDNCVLNNGYRYRRTVPRSRRFCPRHIERGRRLQREQRLYYMHVAQS